MKKRKADDVKKNVQTLPHLHYLHQTIILLRSKGGLEKFHYRLHMTEEKIKTSRLCLRKEP